MIRPWSGPGPAAVGGVPRRLAIAVAALALLPLAARAAGDVELGRALYERNCATCHGADGRGNGPTGVALAAQGTPPRDFTARGFRFDTDGDGLAGTETDLRDVIEHGAATYGGSPLMAPWSHLDPQAIASLVAYVRSLAAAAPPEPAPAE